MEDDQPTVPLFRTSSTNSDRQELTIAKGGTWAKLALTGGLLCERMTVDGEDVLARPRGARDDGAGSAPAGVQLQWPEAGLPGIAIDPSGSPLRWDVVATKPDHVVFVAETSTTTEFPSLCTVAIKVTVAPGKLSVATKVTPVRRRVPVRFGQSVCIALPAPADACTVTVPHRGPDTDERSRAAIFSLSEAGSFEVARAADFALSGGGRTVVVRLEKGTPIAAVVPHLDQGAWCVSGMTAVPGTRAADARPATHSSPHLSAFSIRVTGPGPRG